MSDLYLHNLQELSRPRGCTDNLVYNTAFGLIIDFEHMSVSGISTLWMAVVMQDAKEVAVHTPL